MLTSIMKDLMLPRSFAYLLCVLFFSPQVLAQDHLNDFLSNWPDCIEDINNHVEPCVAFGTIYGSHNRSDPEDQINGTQCRAFWDYLDCYLNVTQTVLGCKPVKYQLVALFDELKVNTTRDICCCKEKYSMCPNTGQLAQEPSMVTFLLLTALCMQCFLSLAFTYAY